jgi:hypothetical protein
MTYILSILLSVVALFVWFFIWGMILRVKGEKVKWWRWFVDYQVMIGLCCMAFFAFFAVKSFMNSTFFEGNETKKELKVIEKAVLTYKEKSGRLPESMAALVKKSPVRKKWKTDEWGKPYSFQVTNSTVTIVSCGPDGIMNTPDDLTLANIE